MSVVAFPSRATPLAPPPPLVLAPNDRILRMPAVRDRVGLSPATIYRRMRDPIKPFPASVPLGGNIVGWRESEINAWIATRGQDGAE